MKTDSCITPQGVWRTVTHLFPEIRPARCQADTGT